MMLVVALAASDVVRAQQSRCADCHFANPSSEAFAVRSPFAAMHLRDWDLSAHSKAMVGCEKCHGGDSTTFESLQAHLGILNASNPASPVNRRNLPRTCGVCHAGPFVAFQKSRHFALLQGGDPNVPTCVTCHGDAGENRPSPKALESACRNCHRADRPGGHPEHPALGRTMLEGIRDARTQLKEARTLIGRIKDSPRRTRLEAAAQQIDVPLTQATQAGHAFVYDALQERLETARRRLSVLFNELVNSGR